MNLHGVVSGAIGAINPHVPVTIKASQGFTQEEGGDGTQIPKYRITNAKGQMQALSGGDIRRLQDQNIQGVTEKIYLNGNFESLVHALGKGGDLITTPRGTYLVTAVLERWPNWCSLALTMQDEKR